MRTDLSNGVITSESTQNFDGTLDMTISQNAMAHIAFAFSNIYNDPTLAVIREYIANAIDATRDNGGEIEIIAPTTDRPTFVVRDSGTGMSFDTVVEVFSAYFESSKNTSSSEIGGWGVGAKSALAIADQFAASTTQNGETVKMVITKSATGLPTIQYNRVSTPDKSNGTSISVPVEVSNVSNFRQKLRGFLWVLNTGNITKVHNLDGWEDKADTAESAFQAEVNDEASVVILDSGVVPHGFYLRMGGIYYENDLYNEMEEHLDYHVSQTLRAVQNMVVIVDIPIDSVDLAPNREGVRFTTRTKEYLTNLVDDLDTTIYKMFTEFIEESSSYADAVRRFDAFNRVGTDVPSTWEGINLGIQIFRSNGFSVYMYDRMSNILTGPEVQFKAPIGYYRSDRDRELFLIELSEDDLMKNIRQNIRQFITERNANDNLPGMGKVYFFTYSKNYKDAETDVSSKVWYSQTVNLDDAKKIMAEARFHEMKFSEIVDEVRESRKKRKPAAKTKKKNTAKQERLSRMINVTYGPEWHETRLKAVKDLVEIKDVISLAFAADNTVAYNALSLVMDDFVIVHDPYRADRDALTKEVPGYRRLELDDFLRITGNNKKDATKSEAKCYIEHIISNLVSRLKLDQESIDKLSDPIIKNALKNTEKNTSVSKNLKLRRLLKNDCSDRFMDLVDLPSRKNGIENVAQMYNIKAFDGIEARTTMLRYLGNHSHDIGCFSDDMIVNYINSDYSCYKKGTKK